MELIAFAPEALDLTSEQRPPPGHVVVTRHRRTEAVEWFDGLLTGAARNRAEVELTDTSRLDNPFECYRIRVDVIDPPDLRHIQQAWAQATWLAGLGCVAVLDGFALRWHDGSAVAALAADRPFTVEAEVSVTWETDATPGFGHVIHTRGMVKFGRPDLMTGVASEDIDATHRILNRLARMQAEGTVITPGERIRVDPVGSYLVAAYKPDVNAPQVHLNNDGLLLMRAT
jgi:hypothetical protein